MGRRVPGLTAAASRAFSAGGAHPMAVRAACAFCALLVAPLAGAEDGLTFTEEAITVTATSVRAPLHARFPYRNGGSTAVAITAVEGNCDCVSAAPPDAACAPGQGGDLDVVFDPHGLGGLHEVQLRARLDSGRVVPLRLRVVLPPATVLDQTIVVWALGGDPATRTVDVRCHGALAAARSNDPAFIVAVRPVEAGAHYLLDITPRSTATRALATISLEVLPEGDTSLFAAVGGDLGK